MEETDMQQHRDETSRSLIITITTDTRGRHDGIRCERIGELTTPEVRAMAAWLTAIAATREADQTTAEPRLHWAIGTAIPKEDPEAVRKP